MAKAPRPGHGKTRLASHLPADDLVRLCECLLADTIALARTLPDADVAIACPRGDEDALRRLAPPGIDVVAQEGSGLAAGLTFVFTRFVANGFDRVVAFDTDSPHLRPAVLASAFEALAGADVVAGPTLDGGYYLVGCRHAHPGLFEPGAIGTSGALDGLTARARAAGLSIVFTEPAYDVDVADDLGRLASELELYPERAPCTARLLATWRRGERLAGPPCDRP